MPMITLHAAVDLWTDPDSTRRRVDIATLQAAFPFRGAPADGARRPPLDDLRVGWETCHGELEAAHVKALLGSCLDMRAAFDWIDALQAVLPDMGPEIVAALSHGIVHVSFDGNAEDWSFLPRDGLSAHARMAMRREAARTLLGRRADGVDGDICETWDPGGLPALLSDRPLPAPE